MIESPGSFDLMNLSTSKLHVLTSSGVRWSFTSSPQSIEISAFSELISAFNFLITTAGSVASFLRAWFLINATDLENKHVDKLSPRCFSSACMVAIILARQLPPILSHNIIVNIECLYGMYTFFFGFLAFSLIRSITCTNVNKLWLMYIASYSWLPVIPLLAAHSDPDRSTSYSFE